MPWIVKVPMTKTSSLFLLAGLIGCGGSDAPPPSEVRTRIATDLVAVADQAEASTADGASLPDTTQFSLVQAALGRPFDALLGSDTEIAARMAGLLPADGDEEDPFDGAEAAQWLNDNIFTDANHQGGGIYKVPAALVCTETQYDDNGNPIGEAVDPDCAQSFGQLQLRIRVSENDELLKFALQLGPNHDEPLEVGLAATLLSLTVDLDEAEDAAKSLMSKLGGEAPEFSMTGQITAKLEITGAAAAKASLTIDRDIAVEVGGDDAITFSSKKATVASIALDGNAKSMELALGLGETKAHVSDEFDGDTDLDLPGLAGTATFAAGQPLTINGISLGSRTTTVKMNGQTALSLDLNPNDGRKFDAKLDGDLLTVSPRVDFRSTVNHSLMGDVAPVYDITRVALDGGLRGRTDGSVEVVGGSFAIETNPAGYGFAATSGQCVSSSFEYDETTGDSWEAFAVGACN